MQKHAVLRLTGLPGGKSAKQHGAGAMHSSRQNTRWKIAVRYFGEGHHRSHRKLGRKPRDSQGFWEKNLDPRYLPKWVCKHWPPGALNAEHIMPHPMPWYKLKRGPLWIYFSHKNAPCCILWYGMASGKIQGHVELVVIKCLLKKRGWIYKWLLTESTASHAIGRWWSNPCSIHD